MSETAEAQKPKVVRTYDIRFVAKVGLDEGQELTSEGVEQWLADAQFFAIEKLIVKEQSKYGEIYR